MVKGRKPKLTKEQRRENQKRNKFSKQIENIFVFSGFEKLVVKNWHFKLSGVDCELDNCFIFENILIICEDTVRSIIKSENMGFPHDGAEHKRKKDRASQLIIENKEEFVNLLKNKNPESDYLKNFSFREIKIYYFYFDYNCQRYTQDQIDAYSHLWLIDKPTFLYFSMMSDSIRKSFRYEIFRYLKIKEEDVGKPTSENSISNISAPIIYPESATGYSDGIRIISLMLSPATLLKSCYVLRKDAWDRDTDMYQRLIAPKRIRSIRKFILDEKISFLNNIIVTLPNNTKIYKNENGKIEEVKIENIVKFGQGIFTATIPSNFNSIGIIDGQHRVYAYYESNVSDEKETEMSKLRENLSLLVTGILYTEDGKYYNNPAEQRKFESNLFVTINKNAKQVDADTIIKVQSIMNPTSSEAICRRVIERLNKQEPFTNMFQLSKTENAPIKTASIIQYALASLLSPKNEETSLYHYWLRKEKLPFDYDLSKNPNRIDDYDRYCANQLSIYFRAVRDVFRVHWTPQSKLLKVISLNAFIISYRESLPVLGEPQNFDFYKTKLSNLDIDFSADNKSFPYAGAQYSKFAKNRIIPLLKK